MKDRVPMTRRERTALLNRADAIVDEYRLRHLPTVEAERQRNLDDLLANAESL